MAMDQDTRTLENLSNDELTTYFIAYESLINKNKRLESVKTHSMDVKFAYHIVRLLDEVQQIMIEHDLDLERNREQLKSIRRGEWTLNQIEEYFQTKEKSLEQVYASCTLPHSPDEAKIKELLLNCLEMHYGNLEKAVTRDSSSAQLLRELDIVLDRFR